MVQPVSHIIAMTLDDEGNIRCQTKKAVTGPVNMRDIELVGAQVFDNIPQTKQAFRHLRYFHWQRCSTTREIGMIEREAMLPLSQLSPECFSHVIDVVYVQNTHTRPFRPFLSLFSPFPHVCFNLINEYAHSVYEQLPRLSAQKASVAPANSLM